MAAKSKPYCARTLRHVARELRRSGREYHARWERSEHNDRSQLERYGECIGKARRFEAEARAIERKATK